jgi:hypothetical protein
MRSNTLNKNIVIDFGEDERSVEVEIEIKYKKTTYGEDADGNRGIPLLELGKYMITITHVCLKGVALSEDDKSEVYKEAFAEMMRNWETWTYEH